MVWSLPPLLLLLHQLLFWKIVEMVRSEQTTLYQQLGGLKLGDYSPDGGFSAFNSAVHFGTFWKGGSFQLRCWLFCLDALGISILLVTLGMFGI